MRQLLPGRYNLGNAIFSRASGAYDESGRLAGLALPRIAKAPYGKMALIEEGTASLITSQDFTTGWSYPNFTKTSLGDRWYRFTCTSDLVGRAVSFLITSSAQAYTASIEISNNAQAIRLQLLSSSDLVPNVSKTIPANSTGRQYITGTQDDASDPMYFHIFVNDTLGNSSGMYFDVRFPQLEPKPYPTSWTPGTRAAESLTMPVLATNLLTVDQASFESGVTWIVLNDATIASSTEEHLYGNSSLKIITPGAVADEGFYTTRTGVSGNTYTYSIYLRGSGNIALRATIPGGSEIGNTGPIVLTDNWVRYAITITIPPGVSLINYIVATQTAQAVTFYADDRQLELGPYVTTWNLPTGATTPRMGLPVEHGTIEGIVEITDVTKRTNQYSYWFHLVCPVGFLVLRHSMSTYWQVNFGNESSEWVGNIADSLTPNGLYYYKVYWDISANNVVLEIWSLSARTKVGSVAVAATYFPTAFSDIMYIGRHSVGSHNNTRFGCHRLSNIVRTDDPDFNNLMPMDANTVAIFDPTYSFLT